MVINTYTEIVNTYTKIVIRILKVGNIILGKSADIVINYFTLGIYDK